MKKLGLFLALATTLLACTRKEHSIRAEVECFGVDSLPCYIEEGVKPHNKGSMFNEQGHFTGQKHIEYTAETKDLVYIHVYNDNDTNVLYTVKYYIDDALVLDCQDSVTYSDGSKWDETSCYYSVVLED